MAFGGPTNGHPVRTGTSELLRIATAGSVDDGKSTLIGRLLYDSKQIPGDQLEHVVQTSQRRGDGYLNLALLTDGLRAEREQGITIDVAYRYFQTGTAAALPWQGGRGGRKFIIADTPGHEQYTRNMVTGASTADLSIVLIDARIGVSEQTRRHVYIASLLRIPHLVVCVNKMDLVSYDEAVFDQVVDELTDWAARLEIADITFIPVSALHGDNVVTRSGLMEWYGGPPLLYHLEHVVIAPDRNLADVRFPVQWVIRPMSEEHHDYRGYAGQVASGVLRVGHDVLVLPSGLRTQIAAIDTLGEELDSAFPTMSVTLRFTDHLDISRGDMIVAAEEPPPSANELQAVLCWMSGTPLRPGARYAIKHTTRTARAVVEELAHRVDVNTLGHVDARQLDLNEIGRVRLRTSAPLIVDPYARNRTTGSFILIDEDTNDTAGAGMVAGVATR
ncbi:MAG: sulfate adenylyltransferase subunit 1 [Solirubrobacteraceae bacterium]